MNNEENNNSQVFDNPEDASTEIEKYLNEFIAPLIAGASVNINKKNILEFLRLRRRITKSALGLKCSTGTGKSHLARKSVAETIRKLRANRDLRPICFLAPTLKLAKEQLDLFISENPDLKACLFIGCSQDNPDDPKEKMCRRYDVVSPFFEKEIYLSGFCQNSKTNEFCTHHISNSNNPCGYSLQSNKVADVWFLTHPKLFYKKPNIIDPALLVIDESYWQQSLQEAKALRLDTFNIHAPENISNQEINEYHTICQKVYAAIDSLPNGYFNIHEIDKALNGEGRETCIKALDLENTLFNKVDISPADSDSTLKSIFNTLSGSHSHLRTLFWSLLIEPLLRGGLVTSIKKKTLSDSKGVSVILELHEHKGIHNDWNLPTILLDAELSTPINKMFFSDLLVKQIRSPMQNTVVTQIIDKLLSKQMLLPNSTSKSRKNEERVRNLKRIISITQVLESRIQNGVQIRDHADPVKILLITNKAIEEKLISIGLPRSVATLHYKATSGLDIYKNVPCMLLVGRIELTKDIAEHQASLLKGEVVSTPNTQQNKWYQQRYKEVETNDIGAFFKKSFHPDTITEEIRYSWCESELMQALGRVRAVRRDKPNPLEIFILTNVPLPVKVDNIIVWDDIIPTTIESVLAKQSISPLSPNEMVRVNSEYFSSKSVARTATKNFYDRYPELNFKSAFNNLSANLPIGNSYRQNSTQFHFYHSLLLIQYTRAIKGAKPCRAIIRKGHGFKSCRDAVENIAGKLKQYKFILGISSKQSNKTPKITVPSRFGYQPSTGTWEPVNGNDDDYELVCGMTEHNRVYVITKIK